MADAKDREEWNKASHIIAMIHNTHAKREDQLDPNEFNPYMDTGDDVEYLSPKETNQILKDVLGIEENGNKCKRR